MSDRCYLRGWSLLGIFNTVAACLFNRVLVLHRDMDTQKVVGWRWDKAVSWPPEVSKENRVVNSYLYDEGTSTDRQKGE